MKVLELDILFNRVLMVGGSIIFCVGRVTKSQGLFYEKRKTKRAQKIKLDFFEVSLVRQNANNVF